MVESGAGLFVEALRVHQLSKTKDCVCDTNAILQLVVVEVIADN